MALPRSPLASVDKQSIIRLLEATGSHDPDVLERERTHLLTAARAFWMAGAVLLSIGITISFTGAGVFAGIPMLVVATWVMYRGKRNVDAIKSGFAEFARAPGP